jgi:hypothetical protein
MFKTDPNLQQGRQFLMYEEKTKDELLPSLGLIEKTTSPKLSSIIEALEGKDSVKSKTNVKKTNISNLEEQFNSTLVEYTTLYKTISAELLVNKNINVAIDKVNSIKEKPTFPNCKIINKEMLGLFCNEKLIDEFPLIPDNPKFAVVETIRCAEVAKSHGPCPPVEKAKQSNIPFEIQKKDIEKLNQLGDQLLKIIEEMMVELAALEIADTVVNKEIEISKQKLQKYKDNLKHTRDEINGSSSHNINFSGNREDANLRVNSSYLQVYTWLLLLIVLLVIIVINYSGFGQSKLLNGIMVIVVIVLLYYLVNYFYKN